MKVVIYKTERCSQCGPFINRLAQAFEDAGLMEITDLEGKDTSQVEGIHGISTVPTTVIYSEVEPPTIFPGVFDISKIIEEVERIYDKEDAQRGIEK